jgi:hypothetical protein
VQQVDTDIISQQVGKSTIIATNATTASSSSARWT